MHTGGLRIAHHAVIVLSRCDPTPEPAGLSASACSVLDVIGAVAAGVSTSCCANDTLKDRRVVPAPFCVYHAHARVAWSGAGCTERTCSHDTPVGVQPHTTGILLPFHSRGVIDHQLSANEP